MQISTFWKLILKSIGLWLLIKLLDIIPGTILVLKNIWVDRQDNLSTSFVYIAAIVIYLLLIWLFLFKDNNIINTLKLDKSFGESHINLSYPAQSILKIAVIVTAALILVESLPALCFELFQFWQQKNIFGRYEGSANLIFNVVKSILAFLVMTNSSTIARWITSKTETKE